MNEHGTKSNPPQHRMNESDKLGVGKRRRRCFRRERKRVRREIIVRAGWSPCWFADDDDDDNTGTRVNGNIICTTGAWKSSHPGNAPYTIYAPERVHQFGHEDSLVSVFETMCTRCGRKITCAHDGTSALGTWVSTAIRRENKK